MSSESVPASLHGFKGWQYETPVATPPAMTPAHSLQHHLKKVMTFFKFG